MLSLGDSLVFSFSSVGLNAFVFCFKEPFFIKNPEYNGGTEVKTRICSAIGDSYCKSGRSF